MKYMVFSLDRYKLKRSELNIEESGKDTLRDVLEEHFDKESIQYWEENNMIWISEDKKELVIDEEESGYFFKMIE